MCRDAANENLVGGRGGKRESYSKLKTEVKSRNITDLGSLRITMTIKPSYPTSTNPPLTIYNADWISRLFSNFNNDFSLSHQAFACIIELPFPLKVDMFASKYSFKLSHHVSRYFEPSAWKVDAFSFPLPNNIYDFHI